MSEKRFWWMTLEERQRKSREALGKTLDEDSVPKRRPYQRGIKYFLADFNVGEIREYNGEFNWKNMRTVAARMKNDYGCFFSFAQHAGKKYIVRIL